MQNISISNILTMRKYDCLKNIIPIVNNITSDLTNIGVTFFSYSKLYNDGNLFYTCNSEKWLHNKFTRDIFERKGFIFDDTYLNKNGNATYLLTGQPDKTNMVQTLLLDFGIWHVFDIYTKRKNYVEITTFGAALNNTEIINLYINNVDLLRNFAVLFRSKINKHIENIEKDLLIKILLTEKKEINNSPSKMIKDKINKEIYRNSHSIELLDGSICKITGRELQCLSLLHKGFCAKKIANYLQISNRTVEKHIEHLKGKIGCSTRGILLDTYRYNYEVAFFNEEKENFNE